MDADLEKLAQAVEASARYRALAPELVRWVTARERAKGRSAAETVKAARSKLHQVAGAYLPERIEAARWLDALAAAHGDAERLRAACRPLLARHASARERLPTLEGFYAALAADLPPRPLLLDLACGLNPLAIPWMGLPPGTRYVACDIYPELATFLEQALPLLGVEGEAFVWNLLEGAPPVAADVALLLKTIPCLEQLDGTVGLRLLESVQARVLFVSFPLRSLGGRAKGMAQSYAARFEALAARSSWRAAQVDAPGELLYRCVRPSAYQ